MLTHAALPPGFPVRVTNAAGPQGKEHQTARITTKCGDEHADWISPLFSFLSDSVGSGFCPQHSAQGGLPGGGGLPAWPRDPAMGSGSSCPLSSRSPFLPHGGQWGSAHACLMPVSAGGRWRGGCRGRGPRGGAGGPFTAVARGLSLEPGQPGRPGERLPPGLVPGLLRVWFGSGWAAAPGLAAAGARLTLHHRRMTAGTVGVHYRDHELLEVI